MILKNLKKFLYPNSLIGIDIGSHSIKLIELTLTRQRIFLNNVGVYPSPALAFENGEIKDSFALAEALKQHLKEFKPRYSRAAIGLKGNQHLVKYLELQNYSEEGLHEQILTEIEQYIPFEIDQLAIDYMTINSPKPKEKLKLLAVVGKKKQIAQYQEVLHDCSIDLAVVDVDLFAMQNAFELNHVTLSNELFVLIDVGASLCKLNIIENGIPRYCQEIFFGGQNYNDALMRKLSIENSEAENLKQLGSQQQIPLLAQETIRESNQILLGKIKSHIDFYLTSNFRRNRIGQVVVCGGGSLVQGFSEGLRSLFDVEVMRLNPLQNLEYNKNRFSAENLEKIAPVLSVAVGLASRKIGDQS